MVGILLISHSAKAAEGAKEIALQMAGAELNMVACGGNKAGGVGTDPEAISNAFQKVNNPDGVVIIADLGSAVMCAEMVLENIPDLTQTIIANAPLVEGAVLAAVEASMGKNLVDVATAAEAAYNLRKVERSG